MDNHNACESAWLNGYKAGFEGAAKKPVDVAIVVRCKDCKHMIYKNNMRYCTVWNGANGMGDDGYCNYGERKDNG